jgi:hypothetical protein
MGVKLKDQLFAEAMQSAFQSLPYNQQESLDKSISNVRENIRLMGALGALELWSKVGIFTQQQSDELRRLLQIIEDQEKEPCTKSKPSKLRKMAIPS